MLQCLDLSNICVGREYNILKAMMQRRSKQMCHPGQEFMNETDPSLD